MECHEEDGGVVGVVNLNTSLKKMMGPPGFIVRG